MSPILAPRTGLPIKSPSRFLAMTTPHAMSPAHQRLPHGPNSRSRCSHQAWASFARALRAGRGRVADVRARAFSWVCPVVLSAAGGLYGGHGSTMLRERKARAEQTEQRLLTGADEASEQWC